MLSVMRILTKITIPVVDFCIFSNPNASLRKAKSTLHQLIPRIHVGPDSTELNVELNIPMQRLERLALVSGCWTFGDKNWLSVVSHHQLNHTQRL